jgi:hypothetical protein
MAGVNMGVDGLDQLQIQFIKQLIVTIHLFQNEIDDKRPPAGPKGDQVGEGIEDFVKHLSENLAIPLPTNQFFKFIDQLLGSLRLRILRAATSSFKHINKKSQQGRNDQQCQQGGQRQPPNDDRPQSTINF